MSYQPLSKLISQTPTTKELHISTDNWPKERKKLTEIVQILNNLYGKSLRIQFNSIMRKHVVKYIENNSNLI